MQIVEQVREWEDEVGARSCIFGISAVHAVSGESWSIAEVLHGVLAVPADAVRPSNPGNAHASAERQVRRRALYHFTDNLMTRDQSLAEHGEFALDDVQICPANSASAHAKKNVTRLKHGPINLADSQRVLGNIIWRSYYGSFHGKVSILALPTSRRSRKKSVRGNSSFPLPGLIICRSDPGLAPWALFFRRLKQVIVRRDDCEFEISGDTAEASRPQRKMSARTGAISTETAEERRQHRIIKLRSGERTVATDYVQCPAFNPPFPTAFFRRKTIGKQAKHTRAM
jgi:hypothetical protein